MCTACGFVGSRNVCSYLNTVLSLSCRKTMGPLARWQKMCFSKKLKGRIKNCQLFLKQLQSKKLLEVAFRRRIITTFILETHIVRRTAASFFFAWWSRLFVCIFPLVIPVFLVFYRDFQKCNKILRVFSSMKSPFYSSDPVTFLSHFPLTVFFLVLQSFLFLTLEYFLYLHYVFISFCFSVQILLK